MTQKDAAYQTIAALVSRFGEQFDFYQKTEYNETLTRRDFIDPFFKALGWDVDNEKGNAESYREVVHEDRVKVGKALKAPDYSFKLAGGKRLFFVEAKKPSIAIKDDSEPAFQLRRYGWSDKLKISIITNFNEFSVYDCTKKPKSIDKSSYARIKYLTVGEYLSEFDFLWNTFSKEQVLKGSFDRYVAGNLNKKGTTTVDKDFLNSLDTWRTYLATSISWNNQQLSEENINFAVQQIIDRLIFLRIAEDRHIETYGKLHDATKHSNFYHNLISIFDEAHEKYNSGLFDFQKDEISRRLTIENKVVRTIITELYYPESPYAFEVLPVEILGNAYEQFLGKVIRITPAHHAKIEEKPEVRKAGGVFYTPQSIVDYIVQKTVGKKVEGRNPKEVSKVKILDPACGSGSFLLGAYHYLLNWHLNYYLNELQHSKDQTTKHKIKNNPLTPDGKLTTAEKKRILLNNIYGVDIDLNAVEVTKLSLLLKCLEGETEASINMQFKLFNDRVLPDLDNNIRCGNSLVEMDYHDGQLFETDRTVKPFSWHKAFPEVFNIVKPDPNTELSYHFKKVENLQKETDALIEKYKSSHVEEPIFFYEPDKGFDVVIGNPPYVRQELLGALKHYYETHYSVFHGMADLYSYFIEKALKLINRDGIMGMIVANKWMRSNYGEPLRAFLKKQTIYEIIDFGDLPVFETVTTYPCILIAGKPSNSQSFDVTNVKTLEFESVQEYVKANKILITKESLVDSGWNLATENEQVLLHKIQEAGFPLGKYVDGKIYRGVLTGLNEAFVIDETTKDRLIAEDPRSEEIIKPFLAGRDIKRYQQPKSTKFLIFTRRGIKINEYPAIKSYLSQFKKNLMPKPKTFSGTKWKGRKSGNYRWYEIQDTTDYYLEFEKPKIIYPNILSRPEFTFDSNGWFTNQKCFIIPVEDKYLIGLLNSKLIHYLFEKFLPKLRGGFYEPSTVFFKNFPIKPCNPNIEAEAAMQADIEKLVTKLFDLNEELNNQKVYAIRRQIQDQIEYVESKINYLVYQIFGLNKEEIEIIESVR